MTFLSEWIRQLRTEKAQDWTYGYLAISDSEVEPLTAESGYLNVILRSSRIVHSRRGRHRVSGVVHSHISLNHEEEGVARFSVVTMPRELKNLDDDHLNRVVHFNHRLAGPVPFRGGDILIEAGLIAVASGDLVQPYLELLETMASAAGVAIVGSATPFLAPINKGLDLLLGSGNSLTLDLGLVATLDRPRVGQFLVIGCPRDQINIRNIAVDEDQLLLYEDGCPVDEYPYLLLDFYLTEHRHDWHVIPELNAAYKDVRRAVRSGRIPGYDEAMAAFSRLLVLSPDLLIEDAKRIVAKVEKEATSVMPSTATSSFNTSDLPEPEDLRPFD